MTWSTSSLSETEVAHLAAQFDNILPPLSHALIREIQNGVYREGGEAGPIVAAHRSDIAPQAYDIVVFTPLPSEVIEPYLAANAITLPKHLRQIYEVLNGFTFYGLKLYGIPPSAPLLNRSIRNPLEIGSGRLWHSNYLKAAPDELLFSSRNIGDDGQIGYFMNAAGQIVGRGNGQAPAPDLSGPWNSLAEWLASEAA